MAKLHQLVAQIVIGTMAFGGVACLCPGSADAHAALPAAQVHAHHDAVSDTADAGDCGHQDCETSCESGSAVTPKGSGSASGKTAYQLDDVPLPPFGLHAPAPLSGKASVRASSRLRSAPPHETPVQRCDRLLD